MISYQPDLIYNYVAELLKERRETALKARLVHRSHPALKDALLYRSGAMFVRLGRHLQCAVGPEYNRVQVALKQR
jgi:hypothetical protein